MTARSASDLRVAFQAQGAVHVRGALDPAGLEHAEAAYRWSLENPGPHSGEVLPGVAGSFYQDHANPAAFPAYRPLIMQTPLARLVAEVLGSTNLWLMYEQVWLKEGAARRRTPWHQDLGYVPIAGEHLAVVWLNLDAVSNTDSLELVGGSHRGPLYNPTAFDAKDASAAMFAHHVWPPLPDIESDRSLWKILSWAIEPGDIVIFHPGTLHGGAATRDGIRRRTISLRFFGDEAYCAARPEMGIAPTDRLRHDRGDGDPMTAMAYAEPGTLFRHPGFHRVL